MDERVDAVADAFAATPRAGFLPRRARRRASYDGPIQIGHGQTNSQPRTVANMLRLLEVRPGDRVLDVGSGSGWTTALLAHLTGPTGSVVGVELVPELVAFGRANLARADTAVGPDRGGRPGPRSAGRARRRTTGSWSPPHAASCRSRWSTSWRRTAGW